MISLIAACLPPHASPEVRLLALQCVLRCDSAGTLALPHGLVGGMRLGDTEPLWQEMREARWIHSIIRTPQGIRARLNDPLVGMPGRGTRARAAHWALLQSSGASIRYSGAAVRLAAVTLHALTQPPLEEGVADSQTLARLCGTPLHTFLVAAQALLDASALKSCSLSGEDLVWSWPGESSPQLRTSAREPSRRQ
ncbi:hypothetical protein AB0O51_27760 [Streptomyces sp. NPDC090301]|uniref:hypothetical protein n=1 Tax=Streptomyces sp. NPDC090301 TaxID=3154975 RepID=UPI0034209898